MYFSFFVFVCAAVYGVIKNNNNNRERKCADTTGTVPVPGLAISNAKILIHFQKKYTEAILSNSTRKLLWFEIRPTKMLIAV